jgi:hypothetical protein
MGLKMKRRRFRSGRGSRFLKPMKTTTRIKGNWSQGVDGEVIKIEMIFDKMH